MKKETRNPLLLEIKNDDLSQAAIYGYMGKAIYLHSSLDYILSDILSFSPLPANGGFTIDTNRDTGYIASTTDESGYDELQELICDDSSHGFSALDLIQGIHEYMAICSSEPCYMNIANFRTFLAIRQIDPPHESRSIVFKQGRGIDSRSVNQSFLRLISSEFPDQNCLAYFDAHQNDFDIISTFQFWGYADLALTILYIWLEHGLTLKRCEQCGNWFSPSRANEKYCERTAPGYYHKTCKEAAKYEKQLERERSSESSRIYKSISTMLAAKCDAAKNSHMETEAVATLNEFRDKALAYRKGIKAGTKTEDEYLSWMSTYYKRRK